MTPERYKEVGELYRAVLEVDADRRAAFLVEACGGDEALRQEVASLLGYREQGGLIDQPALEVAAQALANAPTMVFFNQNSDRYRLLSLLGRGGMGEVHLALDTRLQRKVAIKLLPPEFTADADRVRRFEQEARAASALNHPNIITIHEIGEASAEEGSSHYIVTEYVKGETLRQRMASAPDNRLPVAEAVEIAAQVATALTAAHEAGIAHRDIKPENVMVRRDGIVKVLDFGLAKLTEAVSPMIDSQAPTRVQNSTDTGVVVGTPRYMSPEQARGEKVDARTDIFSLGVMLYEMVAGRSPFAGATPSEVIAAILRDEPSPLANFATAIPLELDRIVIQALRKDRAERYQSAIELLSDLRRLEQRLGMQTELARSGQPEAADEVRVTDSREATALGSAPAGQGSVARAATNAEVLIGKLKSHKLGAALTMSLAAVAAFLYYNSFVRQTIDSLAVLPFVNVGANPDTEYLSDGITDSLINRLSQLPRFKVMSRNSVFRYKGKETDAQQAGKSLGVRAVLTGKVIPRGADLILSVELVDVRDNSHLWGEQYNHKLSDLLAVQAELARDISQQLRLKLSNETQQRLVKRGTENPEAYELYLKGRSRFYDLTPDRAQQSLEYFQRAIEKDPSYASAYAGLAESYVLAAYVITTPFIPPKEAGAKAKDAALMAVKLDDTLAEAHTSLGMVAMLQEWDWKAAEREFKRAIALNPNYVPALHWYSHYLIYLGRFDESLAESQRALALDPLDTGMKFHLGFHYFNARQYDQAIATLQKILEINPNHSLSLLLLGAVYEQQGRYPEAIAEMQKVRGLSGSDHVGALGHVYATSGQRGEAEKLLAQLLEEGKRKYVSPFSIAWIYEGLGQQDQAFEWLEKAYTERDSNLTNLKVEPRSDRLRSDPRFTDLLRRMGLTP